MEGGGSRFEQETHISVVISIDWRRPKVEEGRNTTEVKLKLPFIFSHVKDPVQLQTLLNKNDFKQQYPLEFCVTTSHCKTRTAFTKKNLTYNSLI